MPSKSRAGDAIAKRYRRHGLGSLRAGCEHQVEPAIRSMTIPMPTPIMSCLGANLIRIIKMSRTMDLFFRVIEPVNGPHRRWLGNFDIDHLIALSAQPNVRQRRVVLAHPDRHHDRRAADLTIFNIVLVSGATIDRHLKPFAAPRAVTVQIIAIG